jgi:hypothetical protein
MQKKVIIVSFKITSLHLAGETEKLQRISIRIATFWDEIYISPKQELYCYVQ